VRDTFLSGRSADREQPQITRMRNQPDIAEMERLVKRNVTEPKRRKKVAIYLAKKYTGTPLREIGSHFGGMTISAVSQICRRMEEARKADKKTDRLLRTLESLCNV